MSVGTGWSERIGEDEAARFDALASQLRALQAARTPRGRALHYKGTLGALAVLETAAEAPAWARVGIFAGKSTHRAYVRFSNGAGTRERDGKPDVRGMAVKLLGVPGPKLIESLRDAQTHDLLGILQPAVVFRDPEEFVGVVRAGAGSPLLLLPRLVAALGARVFAVLPKLTKGLGLRVDSLASCTFFSALPIRWGDAAVKFRFAPVSAPEPDATIDARARDRLGAELAARLRRGPVVFALEVQPFVDESTTPIEDPTIEWTSPWHRVATLTLPKQDVGSASGARVSEAIEGLSFDPWHAPEAFRPLGAMMRARNAAYRESTIERGASPEPDGTELEGVIDAAE